VAGLKQAAKLESQEAKEIPIERGQEAEKLGSGQQNQEAGSQQSTA